MVKQRKWFTNGTIGLIGGGENGSSLLHTCFAAVLVLINVKSKSFCFLRKFSLVFEIDFFGVGGNGVLCCMAVAHTVSSLRKAR